MRRSRSKLQKRKVLLLKVDEPVVPGARVGHESLRGRCV